MHSIIVHVSKKYQQVTSALKQELLSLIKLSNPKPKYVIDEMAKAAGHEVVHIPP